MSVKIGSVLEAAKEGKWLRVPAVTGEFHLKVKLYLPAESYAHLRALSKAMENDSTYDIIYAHIVGAIIDWRGLVQADDKDIPFSEKLLKDQDFMGAMFSLKVETKPGEPKKSVLVWLRERLTDAEAFISEEDPSFLANT